MKKRNCFFLKNRRPLSLGALALSVSAGLLGCAPPAGTLFYGALAMGNPMLVLASGTTALGAQAVVAYDMNGNYIETLADLNLVNLQPKGVAVMDAFDVIAPLSNGTFTLNKFNLFDGYTTFINNTNLNAVLYQTGYYSGASGVYFVLKGGTSVEGFNTAGDRLGNANPAIPTAVVTGGTTCTLSGAEGLTIDPVNNRLFATNNTSGNLNVYNLANINAITCQSVNATMGAASKPLPVILHPNGYLYVGSQTAANFRIFALNGDGTGTAAAVYTDTTGAIISTPTAMTVLPDGSVLVASSGTKEIDRFTPNGTSAWTRVGSAPFLHDTFTIFVNDMTIMKGL